MAILDRIEEEGVRILTLNRPEARNSLSVRLTQMLISELKQARDDRCRCVMIEGRGVDFSAGGDIKESLDEEGLHRLYELNIELTRTLYTLPCPTITMIQGNVMGVSLDVALASDLRFVGESARFRTGYDRFGSPTEALSHVILPRLMGPDRAKYFFFSGQALSGEEAYDAGLATRVFPDERLRDETVVFARQVAAGPSWGFGKGKELINNSYELSLDENLSAGHAAVLATEETLDWKEANTALEEGRRPVFRGL